jgi:hypothetical protein
VIGFGPKQFKKKADGYAEDFILMLFQKNYLLSQLVKNILSGYKWLKI